MKPTTRRVATQQTCSPAVTSNQQIGTSTYVELTFTNEKLILGQRLPQVFASGGATCLRRCATARIAATCTRFLKVAWAYSLTAESVDGVDGCTPATSDQVDIFNTDSGSNQPA